MSAHNIPFELHSTSIQMLDPGDAGTITVDRNPCYVPLRSAAAETRTLARPTKTGVKAVLFMEDDGGDITLTVTGGYDEAGTTSFTFDDVGEFAVFESGYDADNSLFVWRLTASSQGAIITEATITTLTSTSATITTLTTGDIDEATAGSGVNIDSAVIRDGVVHGVQGAPTAETGAATVTIADILSGIVTLTQSTGGDVALTLDTGTAMDAGMPASFGIGQFIDWTVINLSAAAADTGTVTASSGHTVVGVMIVQSAHSTTGGLYGNAARFRSRRTAANTWITYRIG